MRVICFFIVMLFIFGCTSNTNKRVPRFDVIRAKLTPRNAHADVEINRNYAIDSSGDMIVERGGSMLFYNQPSGVYYKGKHSRTYLTWLNTDGVIRLTHYDDFTDRLFQFVNIYKWNNLDDHAQPIIHVMQHGKYAGHLLIFITPHNGQLMFTRGKQPESITGFTEMYTIDALGCNYPSIVENDKGQLLVFYNRNKPDTNIGFTRPLYFRSSDDGGDTWSDETELVNFGKGKWVYYVGPVNRRNTVHLSFSVREAGHDVVKNVFHIQSKDWGVTWESNGVNAALPVDRLTPVYSSPDSLQTRVWDIALNEQGFPVIAYVNYDSLSGSSYVAYANYDNWSHYPVANCNRSYYPPGIVIDKQHTNVVYTSQTTNGSYGKVVEQKFDEVAQAFNTTRIISKDTTRHQVRPQMIENYNRMKLLWLDELYFRNYQDFETNLKAYIEE